MNDRMVGKSWYCFVAVTALAVAAIGSNTPKTAAAADEPSWKFGVATETITPQESIWMAGYASRKEPSDGALHDLYAKAAAFEDGDGTRAVIVTLDLIGMPRSLYDVVSKRVQEEYGLPQKAQLYNASHTHSGPVVAVKRHSYYSFSDEQRERINQYNAWLEDALVALVGKALERLQPGQLEYSYARAGFAMNRRLPVGNDIRNSPNPPGPVDHRVPVLKGADGNGDTKLILFGYACHNTTLGLQQFSGDYAGYAQREVEADYPGATAMFVMGCGGDQNPYPRGQVIWAERHGRALANGVAAALTAKGTPITGSLRTAMTFVDLEFAPPPTREQLERDLQITSGYKKGHVERLLARIEAEGSLPTHYSFPVQRWQFGDQLTVVTLGGETVVDFSLRIQEELEGNVWVAGYSNDVFGYVPSRRVLEEGGYEGGGAMTYTSLPGPFAPEVEETIIDAVHRLGNE